MADSIILSHVSLLEIQYSLDLTKSEAIDMGISKTYFEEIFERMIQLNKLIKEKKATGESVSCELDSNSTIKTKVIIDEDRPFLGMWSSCINQPFSPYTYIYLMAPQKISAYASGSELFWSLTLKQSNSPYSSHTFTHTYPGLSGIHYFQNNDTPLFSSKEDSHSWTFESYHPHSGTCCYNPVMITLLRNWY